MKKIMINDIKIKNKDYVVNNTVAQGANNISMPVDIERRNFFKYAAIGGASMLSLFLVNKLTNFKNIALSENSSQLDTKNKTTSKNTDSLAFTENNKEMIFYDKRGNELLIFEK